MKKSFNFIDLFSGIGGFHLALKKFGGNLILASEIDKYANETYKENFNFNSNLDIYEIDEEKIKNLSDVNVLTAGFPCQTFSVAGKRKGFSEERGKLIFKINDLVKKLPKKPKIIILENVKHLTKHLNGKIFQTIKTIFSNIGYVTVEEPIIISPHFLGIPQHRPRVIIPFIYLGNNSDGKDHILQQLEKIRVLKKQENYNVDSFLEKNLSNLTKFVIKNEYQLKVFAAWEEFVKKVKRLPNRTLPVIWCDEFNQDYSYDHFSVWKQKYVRDIREIYKLNKKFIDNWLKKWSVDEWKKRDKKFEWQVGKENYDFKNSFIQLRQSGIRCRVPTMFPTLVAMVQIPIIFCKITKKLRYLTPREVANIQNFPTHFKIHKNKNQAYKQFGNAVNVAVIQHVFAKLEQFLD